MQRRSFVRASLLGATATACRPQGESAAVRLADGEDDGEVRSHLARLDRGMQHIACSPITTQELSRRAANGPAVCKEDPLDDQLVRSSLRALLLTGSVKDLKARDQQRPVVKDRLRAASPEVDFAVFGMTSRLEGMSAAQLEELQASLREDPDLADRVAETIADEAQDAGIPLRRRLHFRKLVSHVLWRLKNQPAELLIEEYTRKVRRHTAQIERKLRSEPELGYRSDDPEVVARWQAQTLQVIEKYQPGATETETMVPASEEPAASKEPALEEPPAQPKPDPRLTFELERARELMLAGGIVFGVGVGVVALGVGLLVGLGTIAGAYVLTGASILLITGIVLLIVGAVRKKRFST